MSFTVLETIFKVGFAYRTMCFTIVIIGVLSLHGVWRGIEIKINDYVYRILSVCVSSVHFVYADTDLRMCRNKIVYTEFHFPVYILNTFLYY